MLTREGRAHRAAARLEAFERKAAETMNTAPTTQPAALVHVHAHCGDAPAELEYDGPIRTDAGMNPAAHGGHAIQEVCSCGLIRFVNVRGEEREEGSWLGGHEDGAAYHFRVTAARALLAEAEALVAATEGAKAPAELREVARAGLVPAYTAFTASLEVFAA
jgi:hypothetical protein